MKKVLNIFFTLIILTGINCHYDDSGIKAQNKFERIDSLIIHAISDSAFPGAVMLVSKDGEILYEKAFGHFTYDDTSSSVTINTIYDIASLTKVIATTTAAMICYDRGMLNLDESVVNYIPEFEQSDKKNVTIKNLLLHNSGLPAYKRFYNKFSSPEEILNDIYPIPLEYKTGTKTIYSDLGMIVLGKVIEHVTGKRLDEFCREEIFQPLEMNSTFFNPSDSIKYKIAPTEVDTFWRNKLIWGEVHDETASLLNGVAGHAGLFSTAGDIANLLQMILNDGRYNNRQFINKETIILFTKKYSDQSTRALGWDTKSEEGSSAGDLLDITSFGHTGFTGTSVWVDPSRKLFVVFLTNRVYPTRENKKIYKIRPDLHNAVIQSID